MSSEGLKMGVIGVGKMGSILARILSRKFPLIVYDVAQVPDDFKEFAVSSVDEIAKNADVIFIAVKPKDIIDVLSDISPAFSRKLIVSVAAGVRSDVLKRFIRRWARLMPNICAEQNEGIFAILSEHPEDSELLKEIFSDHGKVFIVKTDDDIDIFTAVAASGPGYISEIFESFEDALVRVGLSRGIARTLSAQVFLGTAKMILGGKSPYEIKSEVMTPGGTTAEGLVEMVKAKPFIFEAVEKAMEKSKYLSSTILEKMK